MASNRSQVVQAHNSSLIIYMPNWIICIVISHSTPTISLNIEPKSPKSPQIGPFHEKDDYIYLLNNTENNKQTSLL